MTHVRARLLQRFVDDVVAAIRNASLDEHLELARALPSRVKNERMPSAPQSREPIDGISLESLPLSARMRSWAHQHNVTTVVGLGRIRPRELSAARNVGSRTIAKTRMLIEPILGMPWKDFAGEPPPRPQRLGPWETARLGLSAEQRSTALEDIDLPARMRSYVAELHLATLGQLAEKSAKALSKERNIGRVSLRLLARAVTEHFGRAVEEEALTAAGFLAGLARIAKDLEPRRRSILTKRSGLAGEPQTLNDVGARIGLTKFRIHHIERDIAKDIRRRPWAKAARHRVERALDAGAVPLSALEEDPWWAGVASQGRLLSYVSRVLLDLQVRVVDVDGVTWLCRQKSDARASKASPRERAKRSPRSR